MMYTLQRETAPTLAEAAAELKVPLSALDGAFGVVTVDPAKGLHTVLIHGDEAVDPAANGPHSNPRIEPAQ